MGRARRRRIERVINKIGKDLGGKGLGINYIQCWLVGLGCQSDTFSRGVGRLYIGHAGWERVGTPEN